MFGFDNFITHIVNIDKLAREIVEFDGLPKVLATYNGVEHVVDYDDYDFYVYRID